MKIYTSYFANWAALEEANIEMVGIALWPPRYFHGASYKLVAPKAFMLKKNVSRQDYIKYYQTYVLDKLDAKEFIHNLEVQSRGKDVALCCYEKPEDFCHRHLLAEWIAMQTGREVLEYEKPEAQKEKQWKEGELFE